jgi:hypothetical protein
MVKDFGKYTFGKIVGELQNFPMRGALIGKT